MWPILLVSSMILADSAFVQAMSDVETCNKDIIEANCTVKRDCKDGLFSNPETYQCPEHGFCYGGNSCICEMGFSSVLDGINLQKCERQPETCTKDGVEYPSGHVIIVSDDCEEAQACDKGNFHNYTKTFNQIKKKTSTPEDLRYTCPVGTQCLDKKCQGYLLGEKECKQGDQTVQHGWVIVYDSCTKMSTCHNGVLNDTYDYACPAGTVCVEDKLCRALTCPNDYQTYEAGQTCIKVHEERKMTWDDARGVCQHDGGDLVEIHGPGLNDFVKASLKSGRRYWMGIRSDQTEWRYVGGQPMIGYHPWAHGEPNNHLEWEWCVEIIANKRGAWNDKRCSRKRPFVCQKPASVPQRHAMKSLLTEHRG